MRKKQMPTMSMTIQEVKDKCSDLWELIRVSQDQIELHSDLTDSYFVHVLALKYIRDPYPYEQYIDVQDKLAVIYNKFPNMIQSDIEGGLFLCEMSNLLEEVLQIE